MFVRGDGNYSVRAADWSILGNAIRERFKKWNDDDQRGLPANCIFKFGITKRGMTKNLSSKASVVLLPVVPTYFYVNRTFRNFL